MTYLSKFSLFAVLLIGVIFIIGSGGSSGGGGTTSTWSTTSQIIADTCGLTPGDADLGDLTFTANGNSVTIKDDEGQTYSGTLDGDVLTFSGSFTEDGEQVDITGTITFDDDTFTGALDYTIDDTCGGSLSISGSRISGSGPVVDDDGGNGGGGNNDPAAIDASNAEDIGTTAGEATFMATQLDDFDIPLPFGIETSDNSARLPAVVTNAARSALDHAQSLNLPTGITINWQELGFPFCGGSITMPDNFGQDGTLNGSITFNNICIDDGIGGQLTLDGTITFSENANEITIAFENLTVGGIPGVNALNATMVCDTNFISCDLGGFVGIDGNNHALDNVEIFGDEFSGFDVDATLVHHVHGEVVISTTVAVSFGLCGPFPHDGSIMYTSTDGSSGSIAFAADCSYTGEWDDGAGNTGVFNGSLPVT